MDSIVVVGASLAGLSAAAALREHGYGGTLTVLDGAAEVPPDRPPLSKKLLAGLIEPDAARQPIAARLDDLALELRLSTRAESLDLHDRTIALSDGTALGFDGLVLATGSTPRQLDTALAGVHTLRTLEDCLAIRADLEAGPNRLVVIGAGFIGAEVAATARSMGVEVTILETAPLPMQRVLPGAIGGFVADLLGDHGVDVRLGVTVDHLEGGGGAGGGRVERVVLGDGTIIDADVVVAGIGVIPSTGWLEGSGLTLGNGVVCDATCLAAPGVVAAGDLAQWPNPLYGETMRIEQWDNAIEQGAYAGRRLLSGDGGGQAVEPFAPVPWFWSDLFDRKLQLAGRVGPDDHVEIVDGSLEERRFVALFRRDDRCVAVLGVNRPRFVVQLRMQMTRPLAWPDALAVFGR